MGVALPARAAHARGYRAGVEQRGNEPDHRALIECMGDLIYTLDLTGAFTFMNANGLAMLGYKHDELIGKHFSTVVAPLSQAIAADHFNRGLQGTLTSPFFEVQVMSKDGRIIDLEIHAGPLFHEGEMIGRQGVARDISALKELQAQIAAKSERLTLLEEQARVAMDLYRRIAELTLTAPADPEATQRALRSVEGSLARATAEKLGLSAGDLEVAELLAQGCSNREIAERIHHSPSTVKDRVSKLMRVLGARSRAEVVARATRQGLIVGDGC